MSEAGDKYFNRLIEISLQKRDVLAEFKKMTEAQQSGIEKDDIDSVEKLVQLKQVKIDDIKKLDEQFEVYFKRMKFELKIKNLEEVSEMHVTRELKKKLREITVNIMDLTNIITSLEKENSNLIKNMMSDLQGEIIKLNQGKKISNIYSSTIVTSQSAYFIDKKK